MSPTRPSISLRVQRLRPQLKGTGRISAICLGLGLSTALAADLATSGSLLSTSSTMATDDQVSWPHLRLFDPGFLVDHLPFKLTIGQTISYNDNVSNLPSGLSSIVFPGRASRGDFYSDTTIGLSSQFPMGAEVFFFNGTYAPREYFKDTALNAQNYSISGGVNFNLADRCSGSLVAGFDQHQAALDETAGFGVNNTSSESFNESASCKITGHLSGTFNSGVSENDNQGVAALSNSTINLGLNNYTSHYFGVGLQYGLSGLDTLQGNATFTTRDFSNRSALSGLGLAQDTQQTDFTLSYQRILTAKLNVSASGGISVFSNSGLTGSGDKTASNYAFTVNYRPTPKVSASFTAAQSTGAPQDVIADVQTSETQSASLTYQYSAKVSISGSLSRATTSNPTLSSLSLSQSNTGLPFIFGSSKSKNASIGINYRATPLMSATAGYTYSERTDTSGTGLSAVSNIFRVGLVYTR